MAPAPQKSLVERIEDDIYFGRLAPGMWLKQVDMERHYGCSRLALRETLNLVAAKGVLRHERNRGYHVDGFDETLIRHLRESRAVLEAEAAAAVVPLVTRKLLAELEMLAKRHRRTVESGTELEQEVANREFHSALLAPCPNRIMVAMTVDLKRRIPLAIASKTNTPLHVRDRVNEHFEMIEALRAGEAATLRRIIWRHIVPSRRPDVTSANAVRTKPAGLRRPQPAAPPPARRVNGSHARNAAE